MSDAPAIPVHLLTADGNLVDAELHATISPLHLYDWLCRWRPYMMEKLQGMARQDYPQHPHWNWLRKHEVYDGQLAMMGFAVTCNDETQGLMWVRAAAFSQRPTTSRKPIVYVEFIESAPWNIAKLNQPPKYRGVGEILLRAAVELSLTEEYKGRVGLHALEQAERFYRRCGMTDLGIDADHQNLRYFEMTEEQANKFINNGANDA